MTIKHAIPKTAEVTHSDGQLWGDIECAIELIYNSIKTGSQLVWRPDQLEARGGRESQHPAEGALRTPDWVWGSEEMEKWCCRENSTQQRAGSPGLWLSNPGEHKEKRLWPIEWGSICCSSVPSPTPSHTQPFQIKWEVYILLKDCVARRYHCVVVFMHAPVAYE